MKQKTRIFFGFICLLFLFCQPLKADISYKYDGFLWFKKTKKTEQKKDSVTTKTTNAYVKLTGKGSKSWKGMFNVFQNKNDYYFEIPAKLLNKDMLVVNKLQQVPSELNEAGVNRGINYQNQMVRFEIDKSENKILIRQQRPLPNYSEQDAIGRSVKNNYISPLIAAYKIEGYNADSTSYLIKVNEIYDGTETSVNNVFSNINLGTSPISKLSRILSVKAFENNVVAVFSTIYSI